ncbi:transposase [Piscirickettsia salmonis]|uniref:transposase n=1 Tax=Piscirickettsia salmonis TaxID=1238 RepID=UPI000AA2378F|nr:transposase [Piscirickettsia salmonis]QGN79165.1 Putative transposase [Piscirickettsia salmonis]QGN82756.1 Putative transposase [Piscirickettsia salmonis]QGN86269.1 Putative transposase [Piscirickettsia salmonis]QGN89773.1 Putative transposase [Piscirickettsia salmonis]QGN93418.1 Putative transposase [Piscirickettsia salmonis]
MLSCIFRAELSSASAEVYPQALLAPRGARNVHVHISVTRGGYDEANDSWSEIYFTRKVIMPMWRYAVTNLLRQTYKAKELTIPDEYQGEISGLTTFNRFLNREYQKFWKVHFAQPKENHQHNVDYLGRYIKRPALANARMEHYDGNVVIFRYLDHKTKQQNVSVATSVGILHIQ